MEKKKEMMKQVWQNLGSRTQDVARVSSGALKSKSQGVQERTVLGGQREEPVGTAIRWHGCPHAETGEGSG